MRLLLFSTITRLEYVVSEVDDCLSRINNHFKTVRADLLCNTSNKLCGSNCFLSFPTAKASLLMVIVHSTILVITRE